MHATTVVAFTTNYAITIVVFTITSYAIGQILIMPHGNILLHEVKFKLHEKLFNYFMANDSLPHVNILLHYFHLIPYNQMAYCHVAICISNYMIII